MKFKKPVLICLSIALAIAAYRCRDVVEYTKMYLTYEPKMYMGSMEPKFPNWFEVMLGGLAGPDKNKNGIRDDVEIYMNREFKSLSEEKKIILYNYAIRLQRSLIEPLGNGYEDEYWIELGKTSECIFLLSENGELEYTHERDKLYGYQSYAKNKTLNNLRRRV